MFVWDLFIALLVAALIAVLLVGAFGRGRTSEGIAWGWSLTIFLVILFGVWAVGVWTRPVGPQFGGVYWLPFGLAGLFLLFLILALIPPPRREDTIPVTAESVGAEPATTEPEVVTPGVAAIGAVIWIALLVLLAAVALAYLF